MTCHQNSPCVVWSEPTAGSPVAAPRISTAPENDIACTVDGLYVPASLEVVNCDTFPPFLAQGVPVGLGDLVAEEHSVTLTNPTDDRVMQVLAHVLFGAVGLTCSLQVAPSVSDWVRVGVAGTLTTWSSTDRQGDYLINDSNTGVPTAKTAVTIPGRSQTRVICPALPAGRSAELKFRRTYSGSGLVGSLFDVSLQPTTVQLWGLVV